MLYNHKLCKHVSISVTLKVAMESWPTAFKSASFTSYILVLYIIRKFFLMHQHHMKFGSYVYVHYNGCTVCILLQSSRTHRGSMWPRRVNWSDWSRRPALRYTPTSRSPSWGCLAFGPTACSNASSCRARNRWTTTNSPTIPPFAPTGLECLIALLYYLSLYV